MVAVSGITPSGRLTLGNYLGALRRFGTGGSPAPERTGLTAEDGFYFVADLHALTTRHDPARLARLTRETALLLLASGLPPGTVFVQSAVPAHAQLGYLLECTAYVGELSRMVQFKEKGRGRPMTRSSLFTYPCLMAADILLYGARTVPVGGDQDQHVELARDLALRFNREYGQTFVVPELRRAAAAARVRDLLEPTTKMSKSAPDDAPGVVRLLDPPDVVRRKVMRARTDSLGVVRYDPQAQPGVSNLLDVLAACTGTDAGSAAAGFASYGELKEATVQAVLDVLVPLQARVAELDAQPEVVAETLACGRERAAAYARPRLDAAMRAVGLCA